MKTKFAIGCLVQWYEVDIIEEYLDSLKDAIAAYDGDVIVDIYLNYNQDLEKCISIEKLKEISHTVYNHVEKSSGSYTQQKLITYNYQAD